MDDEAALLTAIELHPDDDTPRLAYADWLDEHGRPVRAEFIRLQCAIAGLDTASQTVRNAHVHLWKREQELCDDHRRDLLGPLAGALGERDVEFARGFVTRVEMDAERFLEHADAIRGMKPLPDVTVNDAALWLSQWRGEAAGRLELATGIEMQSKRHRDPFFLGPYGLTSWFLPTAPWPRLRELHLEGCEVENAGLSGLAAAADSLPVLTHLDLSQNGISDEGVRALAESPLFARLRVLILGANPITDEGARMLAAAPGRLENLNMRFTAITPQGQQVLLRRKGTKVDLF